MFRFERSLYVVQNVIHAGAVCDAYANVYGNFASCVWMTGALLLLLITYLFSVIRSLEHVQRRHELSDDSEKARLNMSDLDEQSEQGKNNVTGSSAFSDPCMIYYGQQLRKLKLVEPEM